ncbi:MAG: tyrosine-type recombinase/integrase, partial [Solirubrobacteraceae bacterium]
MSGSRLELGRLGPFVEGYRVWLLERGYSPGTVEHELRFLGVLGRWMAAEDLVVEQLDGEVIAAFVEAHRARGRFAAVVARGSRSLLIYLHELGVVGPERGDPLTPLGELIEEYRQWLVGDRGLAPLTVARYVALATRFLGERVSVVDELGVKDLGGEHVTAFLLRECERLSVDSAKGKVGELRSLLRFLFVRGFTSLALGDAVPPVASWRDTRIPRAVPPADVERLIASCDRSTLDGARDAAIVLLLARLGLRSIEVARLELSDLDWRAGELLVRGKGGREDRLPLPDDVGTALAEYLTVRGRREFRRVFLTLRAPTRPIRPDLVGDVVRRACERAGVAEFTPHRLRHALASEMLAQGASLQEISQVL